MEIFELFSNIEEFIPESFRKDVAKEFKKFIEENNERECPLIEDYLGE